MLRVSFKPVPLWMSFASALSALCSILVSRRTLHVGVYCLNLWEVWNLLKKLFEHVAQCFACLAAVPCLQES